MIEMERLVAECRDKILEKSFSGSGTPSVRTPNNPILFFFLGTHPSKGTENFNRAIRVGWPSLYHKINKREMTFRTPDALREAMETENDDGMTDMERTALEAVNDPNVRSTNLVMVYLICLDDDRAEDYLKLLDQEDTSPVGGNKERLIVAVGKMTAKRAAQRVHRFISAMHGLTANASTPSVWDRTSCLLLSDYLYGGKVLSAEQYLNNYSLAADVLLMQYSIPSKKDNYDPPLLPRLNGETIMTASLQQKVKPADQIARALLYQYLRKGIDFSSSDDSAQIDSTKLMRCAQEETERLFREAAESFPTKEEMLFFPNNAAVGRDAGLDGGTDRTFGTWRAFQKHYFEDTIANYCGSQEAFKERFKRFFSRDCGCSCGIIKKHFPPLLLALKQGEERLIQIKKPTIDDTLIQWGFYAARNVFAEASRSAMVEAVSEMHRDATQYTGLLSDLSGRVIPTDESVKSYCAQVVASHMSERWNDEDTIEDVLRHPCSETAMGDRLAKYIELSTDFVEVQKSFFDDLKARFADSGAAKRVNDFLGQPTYRVRDDARLHVSSLDDLCDVSLYDSDMLGDLMRSGTSNVPHFDLCGTNSIDRVAVYQLKISNVLEWE